MVKKIQKLVNVVCEGPPNGDEILWKNSKTIWFLRSELYKDFDKNFEIILGAKAFGYFAIEKLIFNWNFM